jgi:hypothetical protein
MGVVGPEKDQKSLVPREAFLQYFVVLMSGFQGVLRKNLPASSCCQDGAPALLLL